MCISPIRLKNPDTAVSLGWPLYREVPCGKCSECVDRRQNDWAERARRELVAFRKYYRPFNPHSKVDDSNLAFFVTLTYDDLRLPLSFRSGVGVPTLHYRHVTDFFHWFNKRRFRQGKCACSYILVGEYGTHTHRPHYHCLIIGISLTEARMLRSKWQHLHCPISLLYDKLGQVSSGLEFYSSLTFSRTQKMFRRDPFFQVGVTISEVSLSNQAVGGCARYISKYIVKGGDDWYKSNSDKVEKPKLCITKGFGIGYRFAAPADKVSQNSAKLSRLESLSTSLLALGPCLPRYNGIYYNSDWLNCVNDRLTHIDSNGYKHSMPTFVYDKLIPKTFINGKSSLSDGSESRTLKRRLYCAFPETLQSTRISKNTTLVDSLQLWRLAKLNERISALFEAWKIQNPKVDTESAFDCFYRTFELGERQKHQARCTCLLEQQRNFYAKDKF